MPDSRRQRRHRLLIPDAQENALVAAVLAGQRPTPAGPPEAAALAGSSLGGVEAITTLDLDQVTPDAQGVASWPLTLRVQIRGAELTPPPGPARP